MNYSNHNLRTNLQEWRNRLHRANYEQFGNQIKFLFQNIDNVALSFFGQVINIKNNFHSPYLFN